MKRDPVAAVRWFDGQQALTWALQAYYAACREVEPPASCDEPDDWASGGDFLHAFHAAFTLRLSAAAFAQGVARCGSASEALGWPESGSEDEREFVDRLARAGLSLPARSVNNRLGEVCR